MMVDKNIVILAILRQCFNLSVKGNTEFVKLKEKYMALLPKTGLNKVKY